MYARTFIKLWSGREYGTFPEDSFKKDDEIDAFLLATVGKYYYNKQIPPLKYQEEILKKIIGATKDDSSKANGNKSKRIKRS